MIEGLDLPTITQGAGLLVNTAVALILYGMRRDLRQHAQTHERHWHWIEKIRRELWPDTFHAGEKEPHPDAP